METVRWQTLHILSYSFFTMPLRRVDSFSFIFIFYYAFQEGWLLFFHLPIYWHDYYAFEEGWLIFFWSRSTFEDLPIY